MDPTTLAATAIGFIAGEIASGGLKEIGKEVYQAVKGAFKPEEFTFLELLEKYPENKDIQAEVAGKLEQCLIESPEAMDQLQLLLAKANQQSALNSYNVNNQKGKININVQGNQNSPVRLHTNLDDE